MNNLNSAACLGSSFHCQDHLVTGLLKILMQCIKAVLIENGSSLLNIFNEFHDTIFSWVFTVIPFICILLLKYCHIILATSARWQPKIIHFSPCISQSNLFVIYWLNSNNCFISNNLLLNNFLWQCTCNLLSAVKSEESSSE